MKNKNHSEEAKQKLSKNAQNNSNYGFKGKKHTKETRKNMRLTAIKRIEKNNGKMFPNFNKSSIGFFKSFDRENNTNGLYGQQEFHIKELGYWLDYFNSDLKLIIEWDEKHHFDLKGNLREKDVQRQNEIMDKFPDYLFIRLEDKEYDEQEIKELGNDLLKICA